MEPDAFETHEDIPPPPYSETDIYFQSPLNHMGSNSHADAISVAPSSSHSNIVYTPPETPQETHCNVSGRDDDRITSSVKAFFESRPVTGCVVGTDVIHYITVSDRSQPQDYPYPGWAANHQTSEQDWHTFINFLIPDHAARVNSHIIDRTLRAETEMGGQSSSPPASNIAEAQLNEIRYQAGSTPRQHSFEDTVREWNAGFFMPRDVTIRLNLSSTAHSPPMPGAWDTAFHNNGAADEGAGSAARHESPRQKSWGKYFRGFGMEALPGGLKIGPITLDGDRVAIGNRFEADSRGVRWNGQEIRASHIPDARSFEPVGNHHHRPHPRAHSFGERGRCHERRRHGGRCSASVSSASSSSLGSSNSSASSVSSLPDWDDLRPAQIPVAKNCIQAWLQKPDHPVSKAEFRLVKEQIKAANSILTPVQGPSGQRQEMKDLMATWEKLKKQQKAARKQAERERKAAKKERKSGKRERRAGKRQQKWERREQRRQERGARRHGVPSPMGLPHNPPVPGTFPCGPAAHFMGPPNVGVPGPFNGFNSSPPPPFVPRFTGPVPPFANAGRPDEHFYGPWRLFGPGHAGGPGFFTGRGGWCRGAHGAPWERGARSPAREPLGVWPSPSQTPSSSAERLTTDAQANAKASVTEIQTNSKAFAPKKEAGFAEKCQNDAFKFQRAAMEASGAKYVEVARLESVLLTKTRTLHGMQATIVGEQKARSYNGKARSPYEHLVESLQAETENLGRQLERLRLEADEEHAMELAREEEAKGGLGPG